MAETVFANRRFFTRFWQWELAVSLANAFGLLPDMQALDQKADQATSEFVLCRAFQFTLATPVRSITDSARCHACMGLV
jgi:hypothetical protein